MSGVYIRKIEIQGLWNICDLSWELTPEVNVLAGSNGSGKSSQRGFPSLRSFFIPAIFLLLYSSYGIAHFL